MGAQALRWDFSGGVGGAGGGESLFCNDFEEVAASAAATSATASWLPPGASMRSPPVESAPTRMTTSATNSALPVGAGSEKSRKDKSSKKRVTTNNSNSSKKAGSRNKSVADTSKSPTWDPGQMFIAQYDDGIEPGESSMQDMSLSLLNMSLDDETLDALGLTK